MGERYAIIDMMNIAYRAWYALFGVASIHAVKQGLLLETIIKSCRKIENDLCVDTMIFCFDGGSHYRRSIYPEYKKSRAIEQSEDAEKAILRERLYTDVDLLRRVHLPDMGVMNIFWVLGFEADDLIASCVKSLASAKKVYLVSSDEDLYQLIEGARVVIYKPHKQTVYSEEDYRIEHGHTPPCLYASAKAWAGCKSDGIPGIDGIGMKTACKYVNGNTKGKEWLADHIDVYNRNMQLVKLPAPETPKCVPVPQIHPIDWDYTLNAIKGITTPRGLK